MVSAHAQYKRCWKWRSARAITHKQTAAIENTSLGWYAHINRQTCHTVTHLPRHSATPQSVTPSYPHTVSPPHRHTVTLRHPVMAPHSSHPSHRQSATLSPPSFHHGKWLFKTNKHSQTLRHLISYYCKTAVLVVYFSHSRPYNKF